MQNLTTLCSSSHILLEHILIHTWHPIAIKSGLDFNLVASDGAVDEVNVLAFDDIEWC